MIKYEIIKVQGRLFQLKRKFPENRINFEKGNVTDIIKYFKCDTILKSQGYLFLCNEIKEISYEEIE